MSTRLLNQVTGLPFSNRTVRVTNTIATDGDDLQVKSSVAALTVKAPPSPGVNATFCVSDADANAATNPITVSGNGHTIDGAASFSVDNNGGRQEFLFDRGEWKTIDEARAIEERPGQPRVNFRGPIGSSTGFVSSVTATPPLASSGGATPNLTISAATTGAPGSLSAADKTKLDGLQKQGATTVLATATPNIDWSLSGTYEVTLVAATPGVMSFSNAADGKIVLVKVIGNAAASFAFPAGISWAGGTVPTPTLNGTDLYTFTKIGATIIGSALTDVH